MSDVADVGATLGEALGGTVTSVRRLTGGASRRTSAVELDGPSGRRALIVQQHRGAEGAPAASVALQAALLRAARGEGVPVPEVLAAGEADGLDAGWLVVERLEGEAIARRILRDDAYAAARERLGGDVARALAGIHRVAPQDVAGLPRADPFERPLELLDTTGERRPVLELAARWLTANRPRATGRTLVHGDFRLGNLLVDTDGLRGVLDWELAHEGDPAEDLGWLSARAWRFGGAREVGGFGDLDAVLEQYAAASGRVVEPATVRWWQAYAAIKWAVICALQASTHLSGATRSVELAAIGRRVCESEWDLLGLMGVALPAGRTAPDDVPRAPSPFGRPSAAELVDAVQEYLEREVLDLADGAPRFDARVARTVLRMVGRELAEGPRIVEAHRARLDALGVADDDALATAIRGGALDDRVHEVGAALAHSTLGQLLVANPAYLEEPPSAERS